MKVSEVLFLSPGTVFKVKKPERFTGIGNILPHEYSVRITFQLLVSEHLNISILFFWITFWLLVPEHRNIFILLSHFHKILVIVIIPDFSSRICTFQVLVIIDFRYVRRYYRAVFIVIVWSFSRVKWEPFPIFINFYPGMPTTNISEIYFSYSYTYSTFIIFS